MKEKGFNTNDILENQFLNIERPLSFTKQAAMNKVNLEIMGLTYSESSTGAYVLVLGDKHSRRRLPIVIGNTEAESIAVGIDQQKGSRPLTHDLFLRFAHEFGVQVMEVVINRFRDGVYYAMLVCKQGDDLTMIDARPSDAIAIAVRAGCEIYAYESVMEEAGIIMDDMDEPTNDNINNDNINKVQDEPDLELLTLGELEDLLQKAIDEEDYEKAARIRDEINERKQG